MTASEEDEAQSDSKGRGFIGELLGIFSGGEKSNAADGIIGELCRIDGWDVKMQIGSDEARKLGGTGMCTCPLARSLSFFPMEMDEKMRMRLWDT